MYSNKMALLLDMNSTFMFGEDNFGSSEDFSKYYHEIDGVLSGKDINAIIRSVYSCLEERYPDKKYRHNFPTLADTIKNTVDQNFPTSEIQKIIRTFAHHEMGYIPDDYIKALDRLSEKYQLAVVIDIWAPKSTWVNLFAEVGIDKLFSASSFSSDHGMVKPSPKPFELVLDQLGVQKDQGLVIGDSIRRDLGGARAAGVDCVLVGGEEHPDALGCYENLLVLSQALC